MKRFLLLFVLLMTSTSVFAENIDLLDLTYLEKKELYERLSLSFDKSFELPPGIYVVGTDIKAGTYRFMYEKECGWITRVRIGDELNVSKTDLTYDRQSFDLWDPFSGGYYFQLTEAYFKLDKGDIVVIEFNNIRMEPTEKQMDW